jgi:hypothetical protein
MYLKIEANNDGVENALCKGGSLQISGLSAAGGSITIEQSVDGKNFEPASIDGQSSFSADGVFHIIEGNYYIRAQYSGSSQGDIKIILR